MKKASIVFGVFTILLLTAFAAYTAEEATWGSIKETVKDGSSPAMKKSKGGPSGDPEAIIRALVEETNARLQAEGLGVAIDRAFYLPVSREEAGQTIFFNDRTKQLPLHFVPGDPRRFVGGNNDIAYMVDQVDASNLSIATTTAAIDRAMATWDGVDCTTLSINTLPNPAFDLGVLQGGSPAFLLGADIAHAGWVPNLAPGILGAAFPFVFLDAADEPTDVDNNGKIDIAFWEIYYSNAVTWADDGTSDFDVETVALHEAGHGLDQGHFGKLFQTKKNGKLHFAQEAVMNALYTGPQRSLLGTDNGGHCGIWGSWPNN